MHTRARSARGIPVRIRGATNPGGVGHTWVMARFAPWLIPSSAIPFADLPAFRGPFAKPGEVLHVHVETGEYSSSRQYDADGDQITLSRAFFPAKVTDNPVLMANDPQYVLRLKARDKVTREQLLGGNWLIRPAAGLYFKRGYLQDRGRGAGRRAGPRARVGQGSDGAARGQPGSRLDRWAAHVARRRTACSTWSTCTSARRRPVWRPLDQGHRSGGRPRRGRAAAGDPAAAGKFEAAYYVGNLLAGYNVHAVKETGDKVTRASRHRRRRRRATSGWCAGPWLESFFTSWKRSRPRACTTIRWTRFASAFAHLATSDAAHFHGAGKEVITVAKSKQQPSALLRAAGFARRPRQAPLAATAGRTC
jgi:hypothetical protein